MRHLWRWRVRTTVLVGVVAVGLVALGIAGSGAGASPKRAPRRVGHPDGGFVPSRGGFSASARELSASARRAPRAKRVGAPVTAGAEVPGLRRADSDTFVAGSGRLVTKIYPSVVNYRTPSGSFAAIKPGLTASASGYRQRANNLGVVLPKAASQLARVSDAGGGLMFGLQGATGLGSVSGTTDTFAAGGSGRGLSYASLTDGVGWQATAAAGQGLRWLVKASSGLSAKLSRDGVEFRDPSGKVIWVFHAPTAHTAGAQRPVATKLTLTKTRQGTVITITTARARRTGASTIASASASFASYQLGAASVVPAALGNPNPTVYNGEVVAGVSIGMGASNGDCYLDSGAPDTSFCVQDTNYVGPDDHTLLNFDVADNLPSHVQVLEAFASMTLSSESTATAEEVGVYQATEPWTNFATWNSYDGNTSWTTPGGDYDTTIGDENPGEDIGASGDVGQSFYWAIPTTAQGWIDGNPPQVDGLIFEPTAGSIAPNTLGFDTETSTTNGPYIQVYYEPRMGDYPGAQYSTQSLTDRSSVAVNDATGNLLVSNDDLNLTGVSGLNVNIGRFYNNLSSDQDSFGVGWSMGTGTDTYLAVPCDNYGATDYFDGTGNAQLFTQTASSGTNYVSPPGVDAVLTNNDPASAFNATTFTLTFRHSGITETFTAPAGECNKVAQLSTVTDRNGNTIAYDYNTSGQLDQIVDSYGNTTTISYSTAGYVSEIVDPTGRTYQYAQDTAGQLTSYTDPRDNTTHYSYDSYGNLTQIQTPQGNITNIGYDAGSTNAVTSVTRLAAPTDSSGPQTTYQYGAPNGTCPAQDGATQTAVKDPDGHVTTYCTDDLSRLTQRTDANGRTETTSYTSDGLVSQTTDGLGTPTSYSYDADDNLTSIQHGANGATPAPLITRLDYTDATNPYLATKIIDPKTTRPTTPTTPTATSPRSPTRSPLKTRRS